MLIWYLGRGAGLAAFAALSVATGAGAYTARRSGGDAAGRIVWQYVHRAAALSGVTLLILHVVTLVADSYADVGLGGLLPFGSGYRPLAVTLGVLSMYALTAVTVTGALRSRMAASPGAVRWWRRVHVLAYGAWALSAVHFLLAGTDAAQWWSRTLLVAGTGVVLTGVVARVSEPAVAAAQEPALVGASR